MAEKKTNGNSSYRGEVTVSSEIVEKIAWLAATEVEGVVEISPRNGLKNLFGILNPEKGVRVEVGSREVAVDLDIAVEYGSRIPDIVRNIRRNIMSKVTDMTGLEVVELNIRVNDLHFEEDRFSLTTKGEIPEARVR